MQNSNDQLEVRTKEYSLRIVRLVRHLLQEHARDPIAKHIAGQVLRAGTSVGANYRAACRARSRREFCAKMGIVEEECDETIYWLELLAEIEIVKAARVGDLIREGTEILSMTVSSIKTARNRDRRTSKSPAK